MSTPSDAGKESAEKPMPCGHPQGALNRHPDAIKAGTTVYCCWCDDLGRLESVTRERDEAKERVRALEDAVAEAHNTDNVALILLREKANEHAASAVVALGGVQAERDDLKRQLEEAQDRHRAAVGVIAAVHMALGEDPGSDNDDLPEIVATLRRVASERSELADALAAENASLQERIAELEGK